MLRLEGISVRLGDFRLHPIDLHIKPGTYLVLLGPTGTGKTVLLETIAGLYKPKSGRIFIKDRDVTDLAPEERHLGIVYQDYALFPHLTVFHNIAFGLRLKGVARAKIKQSVQEMADFLEIGHLLKRGPNRLSGGERQRVALARALVLKPYVLLLDEPLSALDRATRSRIQEELKRIHAELGVTIIHITHDLAEAFFLAQHLVVMKDGRILQEGSPDDVCSRPEERGVAELVGIENFIAATVAEEQLVTTLGNLDLCRLAPGRNNLPERVWLTLPGWSVELFPAGKPADYIWQGGLKIADVHRMNSTGIIEVTLANDSGENLKTYLSRREVTAFVSSLEVGMSVPVGLLGREMHWTPRDNSSSPPKKPFEK